METDLREAFDQGFGPEPVHRPLAERVEAGHRAVRRRRLVGTVLTLAVATVVGLGTIAVLGNDPDGTTQVADEPTASPTMDSWDGDDPARYTDDGILEVRPGATVQQRVDDPAGDPTSDHHSVALAVDYQGLITWAILVWNAPTDGVENGTVITASPTSARFVDWVSGIIDPRDNVGFSPDGSLVPTKPGVTILEQRHPIDLKDFTFGDEPTAAALIQGLSGKKWYVLVRDIDGVEVIPVPFHTGGDDLDAFLDYARTMYDSGAGVR